MKTQEKLAALRAGMKERQLAACIIPTGDPHQSEYMADHWKTSEWISGFTGSAGTVVVTADHAGLWTDSRYFLQAEQQLDGSGVELHKLNIPHTPQHLEWLSENLPAGSKIGIDGKLFSVGSVRRLAKHFLPKKIDLDTSAEWIADAWAARPPMPQSAVYAYDVKFAGVTRAHKLQAVREKMGDAGYHLISTLDDICWLLNLRGNDVESIPVFYAYAVIGKPQKGDAPAWLFIEPTKLSGALKIALNNDGVIVKPYNDAFSFLKNLPGNEAILADMASTSNEFFNAIPAERVRESENITLRLKAVKNPVEIQHIRHVMVKDGVALVRLFRWLEKMLDQRPVPETEVAEKLIECRRGMGDYVGESFSAIVGYQGNGAIVHYRPEAATCAHIKKEGILLLDSGGQYLDGTTDITRTVALSPPTDEQKRDFTLVLSGHIALASVRFPQGTTGVQLDALARVALWQQGYNYGHGTGHGVGFFLSVHEAPQGFSPAVNTPRANVTFEPGMLTSNEPGLYKAGQYGIRIENLVLCVEDGETEFGKFRRFDSVSLYPIDLSLVEKSLLSPAEISWLNRYQEEVFVKLSPLLNAEEKAWLAEKCGKI